VQHRETLIGIVFVICLGGFASFARAQDEHESVSLWDGKAPEAVGTESKDNPDGLLYRLPIEKPGSDGALRPCLVIYPGGGYGGLAIDHEGYQIARWANSIGFTAFICKYRMRRDGYGHPVPMLDAQRAVRLARAKSAEWGVDPHRVGIIGFSAGGHLASTVLTHFDGGNADSADPIAKQSSRPDFGILCYPVIAMIEPFTHAGSRKNLLGPEPDPALLKLLNNHEQVTSQTPPTFVFQTQEDAVVLADNALAFYSAMVKHKVPGELHLFQKGKHGVGLGAGIPGSEKWPDLCRTWLKTSGFVD
jgi:acetyl esterase/lipase